MNKTIIEKIIKLKTLRKAVILAHNYQMPEIQDIADFTGDSLGLSISASKTDAQIIIFCGVMFMAETAAILSPQKQVLLPDKNAGCPMADMITAKNLRQLKKQYPDALVVTYVNSTADVKAESDYCCTSSNAVEIVNSLPADRPVIFVPDRHLGQFVKEKTGRKLILWPGYCRSHVIIEEGDIKKAKSKYPDALVLAHPECTEPVKRLADQVLSTGGMLRFVKTSKAKTFIVATEIGMLHPLNKQRPDAQFIPASERAVCPNMKKITLEKILWSLEDLEFKIIVPPHIRSRAKMALDRMLEILPTQ